MEIKKKQLKEIIDGNGDLIGNNAIPTTGSDLETQAGGTTDKNQKIGQQPFRYDMLGRFGFTLMPFMEGKESEEQTNLLNDLGNLMYDRYVEILKFYYKNPNKLKSDYRKISTDNIDPRPEINAKYAKKIMKIVEKHFEMAFKEPKQIDENIVVEDSVIEKKNENEITKKSDSKEVREKKIEKIAGLINKLDKKDVNKIINLLEISNGKQ